MGVCMTDQKTAANQKKAVNEKTTEEFLQGVQKKYSLSTINALLESMKDLRVCVIGDTIIDHYVYVRPKGRAIKDPILSVEHVGDEKMAGGILAIANHVSDFVGDVTVVTLLGKGDEELDFIKRSVRKNVALQCFTKKDAPTITKKRYVDFTRGNKLFKIEYMNDAPLDQHATREIVSYLKERLPSFDLVIVGDFGHGFINKDIIDVLEDKAKFLAVNVQSNSANMGYNYFHKFKKVDFITFDEDELRLPLQMRFEKVDEVIDRASDLYNLPMFLVTLGKKGSVFVNNRRKIPAPVLTTQVKDTVGAGDALFAITSLFIYANADEGLIPLVANSAGGIAVNIVGNKESVTREKLTGFLKGILKD
jgi:rfaE bifunctional protein kinase chain/domain